MSGAGTKSVCYRCSHQESDASRSRCPLCDFPLIVEMEKASAAGAGIEEIFARHSLSEGAPPLPGVHDTPRKAQILAETRRRRRESQRRGDPTPTRALSRGGTSLEISGPPLWHAMKVGLVCASAIMAGVLAAVINHGL